MMISSHLTSVVVWYKIRERDRIPFFKIRSRKPHSNRKLNEICSTSGELRVLKWHFWKLFYKIYYCIFFISISVTSPAVLIPCDIRCHRRSLSSSRRDLRRGRTRKSRDIPLVMGGSCLQPTVFSREPLIIRARVKGLWEGDTGRFGNRITEEL